MKNLTVSETVLLKFFKTPFDEEDAQKIVNSKNAIKSCSEVTIVWAMVEAAALLDEHYGAGKKNAKVMAGLLNGSIVIEEEEEEDLL